MDGWMGGWMGHIPALLCSQARNKVAIMQEVMRVWHPAIPPQLRSLLLSVFDLQLVAPDAASTCVPYYGSPIGAGGLELYYELLYYYTTILLYQFTTILTYYYTTLLLYYYTTTLSYSTMPDSCHGSPLGAAGEEAS